MGKSLQRWVGFLIETTLATYQHPAMEGPARFKNQRSWIFIACPMDNLVIHPVTPTVVAVNQGGGRVMQRVSKIDYEFCLGYLPVFQFSKKAMQTGGVEFLSAGRMNATQNGDVNERLRKLNMEDDASSAAWFEDFEKKARDDAEVWKTVKGAMGIGCCRFIARFHLEGEKKRRNSALDEGGRKKREL